MKLAFCPNCFLQTTEDKCPICGYDISGYDCSPVELSPGIVLSQRYVIGRILGIGGFGITYMCYDKIDLKRYAIKEYMPKDIAIRQPDGRLEPNSNSNREVYAKGLDMFLYETNILVTLSGNKGIVEAQNFIVENNTGYLIMEYIDGVNVKRLLNHRKTFDCEFAVSILTQVASALKAVHEKGLLHRDISPENIMILQNNDIKLIDFGASRFFVGERSKSLSLILKPGFAPPEQYSANGNQGEWTDIYALAATFYKMLTGMTLPDALSRANEDTVQRLDKIVEGVSPSMGKAIQKALALNYKNRYQNVAEFMSALKCDDSCHNDEESIQITQKPKKNIFKRLLSFFKKNETKAEKHSVLQKEKSLDNSKPVDNNTPHIPKPYIRIVHGADILGIWEIDENTDVYIGRDSSMCKIAIAGADISRKHCCVNYNTQERKFIITDLSSNGTYYSNGVRLERSRSYWVDNGGVIILASEEYIMEVLLK